VSQCYERSVQDTLWWVLMVSMILMVLLVKPSMIFSDIYLNFRKRNIILKKNTV